MSASQVSSLDLLVQASATIELESKSPMLRRSKRQKTNAVVPTAEATTEHPAVMTSTPAADSTVDPKLPLDENVNDANSDANKTPAQRALARALRIRALFLTRSCRLKKQGSPVMPERRAVQVLPGSMSPGVPNPVAMPGQGPMNARNIYI
jgi:hypothetical protein